MHFPKYQWQCKLLHRVGGSVAMRDDISSDNPCPEPSVMADVTTLRCGVIPDYAAVSVNWSRSRLVVGR